MTSEMNVFSEYTEFTTIVRVQHTDNVPSVEFNWKDIINSFAKILIDALEHRIDAMVGNVILAKANDRIICANEKQVVYNRKNGSQVNYATSAYNACVQAIYLLKDGKYDDLCIEHYAQILQAIVWIKNPDNAETEFEIAQKDARFFRWADCVKLLVNRVTYLSYDSL